MGSIGAPELLIVLLIILLLFGGAKLPKLARSLREARDEFEAGKSEESTQKPKRDDTKDAS